MSDKIGECEGCEDHPVKLNKAGFCDMCEELMYRRVEVAKLSRAKKAENG